MAYLMVSREGGRVQKARVSLLRLVAAVSILPHNFVWVHFLDKHNCGLLFQVVRGVLGKGVFVHVVEHDFVLVAAPPQLLLVANSIFLSDFAASQGVLEVVIVRRD